MLVDPALGLEQRADLLLAEGRVAVLGEIVPPPDAKVYDATKQYVVPGFIDIHVHLREPGFEHKETITTGAQAAVAGGFTTICAMPNTRPVLDRPERVEDFLRRARSAACHVYPIGAATFDHLNQEFTDFAALRRAGCIAVTDDAFPLQREDEMVEALWRAAEANLPFIAHCEISELSAGGVVDRSAAGYVPGVPVQDPAAESESIRRWATAYQCALPRAVRTPRLHIAHLSTKEGVHALTELRANFPTWQITAETAPHYFALDSSAIREFGPNAKMNPPLRSPADRQAIRAALKHGDIDLIATDHAPHTANEKARGLVEAPFGVVGLETAFALSLTELLSDNGHSLLLLGALLSYRPASLFGLAGGSLQVGQPADVTVIDLDTEWTVDPRRFYSKGRNCPFAGRIVRGKICATFVSGNLRNQDGVVLYE
ncbi:MAG: dihydroorotase [Candidatus Zipacnadales bacterium]